MKRSAPSYFPSRPPDQPVHDWLSAHPGLTTVDRALEVLHEQDEWLMANREASDAKIRTGTEELERGEGIPEDELDAYLARLKAQ